MALSLAIALTSATVSGIILFFFKNAFKRIQEREDRRQEGKAREISLILHSLDALGKLTVANSIALRDGKTNGDMASALSHYKQVEAEMCDYLISTHAESIR